MNVKLVALLLGVSLGATTVVHAQDAPMSLKDCINYGLRKNVTIKRAEMDLDNNHARVMEGVAAYLPQIRATGTFTDNLKLQTQLMPPEFGALVGTPGVSIPVKFGKQFTANGNIQASQTIYDQTYISSIQAARQSKEIFQTQLVKTEQQVIYDIASVFYATQINAEQVRLLEANLARVTQLLNATKVSLDNGFAKKIDYDRLAVTKANLETSLQNAIYGNEQQLKQLKFNMGMPLDEPIQLDNVNNVVSETLPLATPFSPENNTDFKLLQANKKVNTTLHKATLVGYVPSLSFNANYGELYQADNMKLAKANWTPFSSIGLSLMVPIFDGLQKHWKGQQQKIQLQQLDLDEARLKQSLSLQNSVAQDRLQINTLTLREKKNNMDLAQEVYNVTHTSYENGMMGLSDLLNAENELREAQSNYLNALFQIKIAELELLKSAGNIQSIIQ